MSQAQTAGNARRQLVGVDGQNPVRAHGTATAAAARGDRPGLKRPCGSKFSLMRRWSSATPGAGGDDGQAAATASSAWMIPTPISATQRPPPENAGRDGKRPGGADRRAAPGRGGGPSTTEKEPWRPRTSRA